jgi:hypothetical protein
MVVNLKGTIIQINQNRYRYDYHDFSEEDSIYSLLHSMGYQGGGDTWAGIALGILALKEPSTIPKIELDPEAGSLAVWANSQEPLLIIAKWIGEVVEDKNLLIDAIQIAENEGWME